jgi:hypothetical protein
MLWTKFTIAAAVLVAVLGLGTSGLAQGPKDKASLEDKLDKAHLVVVGKVSKVGLGVASSFDVGIIDVRSVLKGKAGKNVHFRYPSRGPGVAHGKVGKEGVWLLGEGKSDASARSVVAFVPLGELDKVKKALGKKAPGKKP